MRDSLQLRNDERRDIITRTFHVRAETVNEQERSVEAVISTETPVEVWDWERGEVIDEVLLSDGARVPSQMPLLANHVRWSLDFILGSIRNLRTEDGQIVGRLYFARDDEDADKAWNKVRQGHLKDVSVGYRVSEAVEIQPGTTATVGGRQYTAAKNTLRVATAWTPKEGSLVPIGADQNAKIRKDVFTNPDRKEDSLMNPKLRAFLESLDLRKDASETDAQAYYDKLGEEDKARADKAAATDTPAEPPVQTRGDATPPPLPTQPQRGAVENQPADPPADPQRIASDAIADERNRVREIRTLAGQDVPAEIVTRAVDDGWDTDRANREFLTAVRESRGQSAGPAIHVTDRERDTNARSLAAGLLASQGTDPTQHRMHNGQRDPLRTDQITEQDADLGDRFRGMSTFDVMRECIRADTGRWCNTPSELFAQRTAPSGATLSHVFTTNVYARLIEGWTRIGDTTVGWCDEEDVPNFLQQEDISLEANARLKRLPRGDTATHATASDKHETYKIARYANQFVVDDQDVIDDRLGAIMRMPMEMGEAARQLRPDLVYALMLENPNLVADSGAVFNATAVTTDGGHANLETTTLSATGIKNAITAMVQQRINRTADNPGHVLNIVPRFLIVPAALKWTAEELLSTAALYKLFADTSDPYYSTLNLIAKQGISPIIDDRIGAIGVLDPRTGTARTGLDTNWFLTAGGSKGLRVAYLRGTGRQPSLRSFMLDKGQWGIGWDIKHDIGGAFMDYRPWYKSTGAG